MKWLTDYIRDRNVRAHVYQRDHYSRIVASVYVRRYFIRRDVGLQLIKQGLATVYEGSDGEFGGLKQVYEKAEAKAKRARKGMWSVRVSAFESPRAYKTKWAAAEQKNDDK
jgi:endonuclease YncB( thermonuclease family)